jgi:hypothetical protein
MTFLKFEKLMMFVRFENFQPVQESPIPSPSPKGEGSLSILNFKMLKRFKKPKTEYACNLLNPLNSLNVLNLLNNALMPKIENVSSDEELKHGGTKTPSHEVFFLKKMLLMENTSNH